jgi:hypothetical protein
MEVSRLTPATARFGERDKIRSFGIPIAVVALSACATGAGVDKRPLNSGTSRDYQAPAAKVSAAAKAALATLPVSVTRERVEAGSTVYNFVKSVTAFSWGEVGRVVVTPKGETAASVFVDTEKRSHMQITGTSEAQFSAKIFDGITAELARTP